MADCRPFTYASFFAGIEGLGLGLELALPDARPILYVERETPAVATLAARIEDGALAPAPVWTDIRTFDGRSCVGAVDCVVAGFPCQDISNAGKRAGILRGKRSGLWFDLVRAIRDIEPRFVFLENTASITAAGRGLDIVLWTLAELGFHAEWDVFSCAEVGASHLRKRWFCLAYRDAVGRLEYGELDRWAAEDSPNGHPCREHADGCDSTMADASISGQRAAERNLHAREPDAVGGRALAYAASGSGALRATEGERQSRTPSASGDVGHAGSRLGEQPARERTGPRDTRPPGESSGPSLLLGNATGERFADARCGEGERQEPNRGPSLPLFAPGPSDPRWERILRERPDLAPAQSALRGVAPGAAERLQRSQRIDELRSLGNLASPLQAATAFTALWERLPMNNLCRENPPTSECGNSTVKGFA